MSGNYFLGYILVFAAGALQGTFMLPMKFLKRWSWENIWLVFSTAAYLIFPWMLAIIAIPNLRAVYASTSSGSLVLVGLFGLGWGLGTLTFGLGAARLGMALGFAVIIGLTAVTGSLIPMIVLSPERLTQPQGRLTMGALALVVLGIFLCAWAGKLRDAGRDQAASHGHRSYAVGLIICIVSGLLSACANLGFAFGSEVVTKAIQHGASEALAGNALWALITFPLFLCNAGYCLWLVRKQGTSKLFAAEGTQSYWLLAGLMGALWIAGFVCYAPGARWLGSLGASVGWAVMMSTMVITANLWGFVTGEWRGAGTNAVRYLGAGVAMLTVAICVVGYANYR